MIDKIRQFTEKEHMIQKRDSIVVGVSGGADSVCLLLFLCALRSDYELKLQVLHINHQLREAATREENYVFELCEKMKVPCISKKVDVVSFAQSQKLSCEEAARILRYDAFSSWARKEGFDKIAVAHHMNDQAETLLFRMARGTGHIGMQGMRPVQDTIIRPLLCVEKKEIVSYLQKENISWMEDESNQDNSYARNMIRNEVIPSLLKVNDGAVKHMYQVTQDMRELDVFLDGILDEKCSQYVREEVTGYSILFEALKDEPAFVQKQVMKRTIEKAAGKKKDIGSSHISSVLGLMKKQPGKEISLPYHLKAVREYDKIRILPTDNVWDDENEEIGKLILNEINEEKQGKKDCIQIIDYDKIKDRIQLRYRREGDYFVFDAKGRKKTLQRFFIDQKVPRKQRERIPLVADGSHIIWIVGMRVSEYYKVTKDTNRQLQMEYTRRKKHE